jgi:eukaryotic-like serine/threonine-protein kinase
MGAGTLDRCPHDATPLLSAEAMARVGTRVGEYEIKSVIGEGRTGVVYRGRHVASDRPVAIKVLHEHCARKKEVVEQFIDEAGATSHPNVIDVTDLGTTPDGTVFLAMEYLEGESLQNRLRRVERLPLFEAINIMRQVARGLGAAHEAGIVHGGLKPANIFLCRREGRRRIVRRSKAKGMRLVVETEESFDLVKLLDFGTARFFDLAPGARPSAGAVCGTPHYLSPEQAQGRPADQRSDIYSLGAVFYEIVTGTVLFGGESLPDILQGHVSGEVIAPSRRTPGAGILPRIDALIVRCLKKNPPLRFASTGELCEALDACVTDCAFLRDARRLPGIMESGIDLSEASPPARQDAARFAEKPAAASLAEKPAVASVAQKNAVAAVVAKPAAASVPHKPAAAPVVAKSAVASVAEKPAVAPVAEKPAAASVPHKPAAAPVVANPTVVPVVAKPTAAAFPRLPGLPLDRGPQVIALAGMLLLGGAGIAVWATRSGSAQSPTKPVVASRTAPAPTPAPSPPPLAAVPVPAPAAPAAAAPAAALPRPEPAAPAEMPAAALPRPEPAAPAEMTGATARGPGELASSRTHPARASSTRRTAPVIPVPTPPAPAKVDDLVREAQYAWMGGRDAAAISKAQAALKAEPEHAQAIQAYEIIATCSCAIGDVAAAREAASHLSDTKRDLVKAMCMKKGVTIK